MEVEPAPQPILKESPTIVNAAETVCSPETSGAVVMDEADQLLENIEPEAELGLVDAPFSGDVQGKMDGVAQKQASSSFSISSITSKFSFFAGKAADLQEGGDVVKDVDWWSTFRSVTEFLAPSAFKKPASKGQLCARLTHNIPYYCTNYMMVWCVLLLFTVLTSPYLFLIMGIITYCWMWAQRQESIGYGSLALTGKTKAIFVSSFATLAVLFFAGSSIVWIIFLTCAIAFFHAAFHSLKDSEYSELDADSLPTDAFTV